METGDDRSRPAEQDDLHARESPPAKSLASASWREGVLTRAMELEALSSWLTRDQDTEDSKVLRRAIALHLDAARRAATKKTRWYQLSADRAHFERATSNLDAAEVELLNFAPPRYVVGVMPSLLDKVKRHLKSDDPRRQEFERISQRLAVEEAEHSSLPHGDKQTLTKQEETITQKRDNIVSVVRGADAEARRDQLSVSTFRNIVVGTTFAIALLAGGIAVLGFFNPKIISLCFEPEKSGQTLVVCPTAQSTLAATTQQPRPDAPSIDSAIMKTVGREDLFTIELVGLAAASVAAVNAIRMLRGSSDPWGLSVALAALKLPTGALTAFLGILLMRGQFVPGLGALDTSGQILAWAAVFGYAQQLFTRLVDQQAYSVLDPVRDADKRN
jgi:hypothetical protein